MIETEKPSEYPAVENEAPDEKLPEQLPQKQEQGQEYSEENENPDSKEQQQQEYILGELDTANIDLTRHLSDLFPNYPDVEAYYGPQKPKSTGSIYYEKKEEEKYEVTVSPPDDVREASPDEKVRIWWTESEGQGVEVSKKIQDGFLLRHELSHIYFDEILFSEREDLKHIFDQKKEEWEKATPEEREKIREEDSNKIFSTLAEGFAVSMEAIMIEKMLADESISDEDKADMRKFWEVREAVLMKDELEESGNISRYDESMIFKKIYDDFGVEGIKSFIKNFDYEKLDKIQKRDDKGVLTPEYQRFLSLSAGDIMKEFAPKKENVSFSH